MTAPAPPEPFVSTPNAERYLLQADGLRRRQLRSALLHGSSRTWRDRQRVWPAVIAGVVAAAVVTAAIAVHGAFQSHQRQQQEQEQQVELPMPGGRTAPAADRLAEPGNAETGQAT